MSRRIYRRLLAGVLATALGIAGMPFSANAAAAALPDALAATPSDAFAATPSSADEETELLLTDGNEAELLTGDEQGNQLADLESRYGEYVGTWEELWDGEYPVMGALDDDFAPKAGISGNSSSLSRLARAAALPARYSSVEEGFVPECFLQAFFA